MVQLAICKAVEECDGGATFKADSWIREDGGGGISMVLQNGKVWEKAGCNLSVVYGTMPPEALQAATERGVDRAKGMKPGTYPGPRFLFGKWSEEWFEGPSRGPGPIFADQPAWPLRC